VAAAACAAIIGGHSIDDREPKYGLAVTGIVHPDEVLTNAGGLAGDALVLTKPLGSGAISTAVKRGLAGEDDVARAVAVMTTLNADAAAGARAAGAHALTDVTGFGLLGHLHELTRASGVAAEVDAGAVPAIDGALGLLAEETAVSGGSRRNAEHAREFASVAEGIDPARRRLLTDAMTSGGLLAAVAPERAGEVPGAVIGRLVAGPAGAISVRG
jgi:selenide,water dikinase